MGWSSKIASIASATSCSSEAGLAATTVAPAPKAALRRLRARAAKAWTLRVPAGVVARDRGARRDAGVDGAAGYKRTLSLTGVETARCGSLVGDDAIVCFELCEMGGPSRRDRALYGVGDGGGVARARSAAAPTSWRARSATATGRSGDGRSRSRRVDANVLRIKIGPDGKGASRPQAGRGAMLHAPAKGTKKPQKKPTQVASVDKRR